MRALVIEDDEAAASYLVKGLAECGVLAERAPSAEAARPMLDAATYDVLVVDRMLPGGDGLDLVAALRAGGDQVPILVLSALSEVDERVRGLRAGADDYLAKPFVFAELHARLEALARRGESRAGAGGGVLRVADLELCPATRMVRRGGREIALHPREFRLLEVLMGHAGRVVTRTMLLEAVWDFHFDPQTNVVDVHISRLRSKIDRPFPVALLHTVRGAGYCLREPG